MTETDDDDLIRRILDQPPNRELSHAVARALGWRSGPSQAGWKVVQPYGFAEGMVTAPPAPTEAAEAWFDPEGRERGGLVGRQETLPPWLTSLDAALSAAPRERRGQVLYHAVLNHAAWLLEHGEEDPAIERLPAFVIAVILEGTIDSEP